MFGDEVQVDCVQIHDAAKQPHWFLSVVDRATSYFVFELMNSHSPNDLYRAFDRAWCKWAGPPAKVTVDFEGGFQGSEFWAKVGQAGALLSSIARTAHWQAGKIERHDHLANDMMYRTIRQLQVKGRDSMRSLSRAKNSVTREHGWSPVALVFGREPQVYGELHQDGNPASFHFTLMLETRRVMWLLV